MSFPASGALWEAIWKVTKPFTKPQGCLHEVSTGTERDRDGEREQSKLFVFSELLWWSRCNCNCTYRFSWQSQFCRQSSSLQMKRVVQHGAPINTYSVLCVVTQYNVEPPKKAFESEIIKPRFLLQIVVPFLISLNWIWCEGAYVAFGDFFFHSSGVKEAIFYLLKLWSFQRKKTGRSGQKNYAFNWTPLLPRQWQ